jgi:hypothetical protein
MPTPLLGTTVRPDWREFEQRQAVRGARLWRGVQAVVVAVAMITLATSLIPALRPWQAAIRILALTAALWALPIAAIAGRSRRSLIYTGLALGAGALIVLSAPAAGEATSVLPAWAVLPAAIVSPALLLALPRAFPAPAAALGLRRSTSLTALLLGAAAGFALGLHLWFTVTLLPDRAAPALPVSAVLIWIIAWATLRAGGEELLFRGAGFHALRAMGQGPLLWSAARLALVNLFVYAAPGPADPMLWLVTLPSAFVLAVVTTFLRARDDTLGAAVACNFIFTLFLAGAVLT